MLWNCQPSSPFFVAAVTVNVAIATTVVTAVVVAATDIKSVAAATVASAAAIVATFMLQLIVETTRV
jgi:hypothetical protein